jgi:hypothetical protein
MPARDLSAKLNRGDSTGVLNVPTFRWQYALNHLCHEQHPLDASTSAVTVRNHGIDAMLI